LPPFVARTHRRDARRAHIGNAAIAAILADADANDGRYGQNSAADEIAKGMRIFCERVDARWRSQLLPHRSSEVVMSVPASPMRKRLLCQFNVHHKWVRRLNPQGEDYQQCKSCGKDLYDVERSQLTMTSFRTG